MNDTYAQLPDESAIIRRVCEGDREAFRPLVERYQRLIYVILYRQVGDAETAGDLTQEVFVRAYLHLPRFRGEARFSSWLTRIAINRMNSYFRSGAYRRAKVTAALESAAQLPAEANQETSRSRREFLEGFRAAVARLKPRQRDVLLLCGVEGRSYEEAAEILKIPIGTVRSRLNHARLALSELMREDRL